MIQETATRTRSNRGPTGLAGPVGQIDPILPGNTVVSGVIRANQASRNGGEVGKNR